ncbi:MAG: HDOD domain-containing protein [Thermodesulfobacteriota bacterium]
MTEKKGQPSGKLAEIFAKMNMSELPAMSAHVQELISLVHSSRSAAYDLSRVILKDYSLTNKVLQVVNSAYYSIGQSVSSISKAVTILGFDAVRDLATAIALFEDFVKSGVDKEGISKLMTRSFLSALQCRDIAGEKKINVPPEEAFICGLLHNLGKIIAFIYLPGIYQEIEKKIATGIPEDTACRHLLEDLTFAELGQEIARFWNLSDKVVGAMETDPDPPKTPYDTEAYLRNLCDFSNRFVDKICNGEDTTELLGKYGTIITINHEKALEILTNCVENSQDISDSVRYGLSKLKIHSKLEKAARQPLATPEEGVRPAAPKRADDDELDELPSSDKSINEFIKEMADTLMGPFQLNEFYAHLLEAIYRGIGFDRVILCVISMQATKISLVGRFGLGDIDAADIANFEQPLANVDQAIPKAMKLCKDVAIEPDTVGAFPEKLQYLVKGRTIYLLPIVVNNKAIALLYMDRKAGRPKLGKNRIKALRLFRDFATMAIKKSSRKG